MYIDFCTNIRLFDEYVKMQFFVNYLFKIYRFLFIIVFNTFFTSKLYLIYILSTYILVKFKFNANIISPVTELKLIFCSP